MRTTSSVRLALPLSLLLACSAADDRVEDPPPEVAWPTLACDPLVEAACLLPWPNNVFTTEDPASPTGRRVALAAESLPVPRSGLVGDPARWNRADGFSPGGTILAHLPGATDEGLATAENIERSLAEDSPTVILNAETGERVLHLAEIDHSTGDLERRALMLTPGRVLDPATRYIVAVRGLKDASGALLPAPAPFAALRDGLPDENGLGLDERRPLYSDIFQRLQEAGIAREDLQLAWDFTTASTEHLTGSLLHMRDEALAMGDPSYTLDTVDPDFAPGQIAFRLLGTMTVPLYLTDTGWPASLNLGADGEPEPVGTWDVPFEVLIPESAANTPAALLQFGHGLLWRAAQIETDHLVSFAAEYNYVLFATNWIGMSEDDQLPIGLQLDNGDLAGLGTMMDRLHQGTLHQLLLMRMMRTSFAQDPDYGDLIDPTRRHYLGISQGGILGGVYMGLTTDVARGTLGVPGQPYQLLLPRSVDFIDFFEILRGSWPDPVDQALTLALVQMIWDPVEPTAYTSHIIRDPLPGTPTHDVIVRAAIGDHQVTPLGAHVMARSMGLPHLDTGLRPVAGLETVAGPVTGSAFMEYDFGLPPAPACNLPQALCDDPHGKVRRLEEARQQLDTFFRTGTIENLCSGPCSFPDMSGCTGGESNADACTP